MSDVLREEGQLQFVPSVPADNLNSDNNVEAETQENLNHNQDENNSIAPKWFWKLLDKMYFVFKEAALILFLAFTYAAFVNNPPRISKIPAAFPFFHKTSLVTDWYRGQLGAAISKARESDLSFIMFYAPWDAESQNIRKEFELTAKYMHQQVTFAAINCWQPGSECRRQYSKAYNWPVLIAYPAHGKGVPYTGVHKAGHMAKFLQLLSSPIIRIVKEIEISELLINHDAVVLGCVNARPGSFDYGLFYTTAIHFLEKDPYQRIAFAVLTGSNSACFGIPPPSFTLHLWNETLYYPQLELKPEAFTNWIIKNLHQINIWITPSGTKSLVLSQYVQPGPTLILFTPRNSLQTFSDYYDLLYEIGLEYIACDNNTITTINSLAVYGKRIENYLKHSIFLKECLETSKAESSGFGPFLLKFWDKNSCFNQDTCKCNALNLLRYETGDQCDVQEFLHNTTKNSRLCTMIHKIDSLKFSTFDDINDARSSENLIKKWHEEKCHIAKIAQNLYPIIFSESITDPHNNSEKSVNVTGLECKTNSSLTFMTMDSLEYYHFAERLGIDLSTKKHNTAAVIIDDSMETHHIMQSSINDRTLREFIYNFSTNSLRRSMDSGSSINSKHTHIYPIRNVVNQSESVCLLELNANTFTSTIMQENKATLVLYYSKHCCFCNGVSYIYLTVAKLLSSVDSIQFSRIDGDVNVLPWEFTMYRYPSIIYFPLHKKSESGVFPKTIPITVPNLVNFILVNLNPSLKLRVMWTICNQTKFDDEKQSCISTIRTENLSLIYNTLRAWRTADSLTKTKLLYKLQLLRNINLLLSHLPENTEDIQRYLIRLQSTSTKAIEKLDKTTESNNVSFKDEL